MVSLWAMRLSFYRPTLSLKRWRPTQPGSFTGELKPRTAGVRICGAQHPLTVGPVTQSLSVYERTVNLGLANVHLRLLSNEPLMHASESRCRTRCLYPHNNVTGCYGIHARISFRTTLLSWKSRRPGGLLEVQPRRVSCCVTTISTDL